MPTPSTSVDEAAEPRRWQARLVLRETGRPIEDRVCATIWPIRSLSSQEDWFEELCLWTEGFEATMWQRARIQSFALECAFRVLDERESGQLAVTLSFGTVERYLDHLAGVLERQAALSHRLVIILRGSVERLRSRYRLRAFVEFLRILHVPVGYLLTTQQVSKELKALGLLLPDFAKVPAPSLARPEAWQDLALEAQVAGGAFERLIVSGLETREQLTAARQVGIPFGQGKAVASAHAPPPHEIAEAEQESPPPSLPGADDGGPPQGGPSMAGRQLNLESLWNAGELGDEREAPDEE